MFQTSKMFAFAFATAVAIPALAGAAPVLFASSVGVNQNYSFAEVIRPGDAIEFRFTALDDFKIASFSMSGTGTNAEADVRDIRFGLTEPASSFFTTVSSVGVTAAGFGFLPGMSYAMGDVFSVFFTDGITNDVGLTLSFDTMPVAPIPLPAAGLLLGPVLLAGAAAALRRRKSARTAV